MVGYVGKKFIATLAGRQLNEVACEKCGKHFFYELSRVGVGTASAPYMLGQGSAKNRAEQRAEADLVRRLKNDEETVPCPDCQWINLSAVRAFRKTRQRGWNTLAILLGVAGVLTSFAVWAFGKDLTNGGAGVSYFVQGEIAGIWIFLILLCLLAQRVLRGTIDPNRMNGGKKRLPPGTPPAMVAVGKTAEGEAMYQKVAYDPARFDLSGKWATFRVGQFQFLPVCCRCLGEASTQFTLPMVAQAKPLAAPLCGRCRSIILRNWWLANGVSFMAAFAIAWGLSQLPARIDDVQMTIMTVVGGGFLAGVGFCVIDQLIRPYRIAWVDRQRAISKIRFRNPVYTALLVEKSGKRMAF